METPLRVVVVLREWLTCVCIAAVHAVTESVALRVIRRGVARTMAEVVCVVPPVAVELRRADRAVVFLYHRSIGRQLDAFGMSGRAPGIGKGRALRATAKGIVSISTDISTRHHCEHHSTNESHG